MMADSTDAVGTARWGAGGEPHARIPEWLLDSNVSDRAIRLYAILGRYADGAGHAVPGKKKLAERLGCAGSTLDATLAELKKAGALSWTNRRRDDGGSTSNDYTLGWLNPAATSQSDRPPSPAGAGAPPPAGPGGKERIRASERSKSGPPLPPRAPSAPPLVLVDGRNLPFDALAEECGIDPASNRTGLIVAALNTSNRGKRAVGIRDLFRTELFRWAERHVPVGIGGAQEWLERSMKADPERFERGLAETVRRKAALYRSRMPGVFLTPTALRDHWLDLELAQQRSPSGGLTPEAILRMGEEATV